MLRSWTCIFSWSRTTLVTMLVVCSVWETRISPIGSTTAPQDEEALRALQTSSLLPQWTGDPCEAPELQKWVNCSTTNPARVIKLNLFNNGLNGTLPAALAQLGALQELSLNANSFTGDLFPGLGQLTNLTLLDVGQNHLTGSVSTDQLANFTRLRWLKAGANNFSGSVPDLSRQENLLVLNFTWNNLTGFIPDLNTWSAKNLTEVWLGMNELTGPLPEFSTLTNITFLELKNNNFNGTIPKSIFQLQNLNFLYLGNNNFSGTIPDSLSQTENLQYVEMKNNPGLTGSIPDLSRLTGLVLMDIQNCSLNGSFPASVANLSNLKYLYLESNKLSGPLPSDLTGMASLESLILDSNQLTGSIPDLSPSIKEFYVEKNQFSGVLPASLSTLTQIFNIHFAHNNISGPIPNFTNQPLLRTLDLQHNNLVGNLPDFHDPGTYPFSSMEQILLNNNQLSGTIRPTYGKHPNLKNISLSYNRLEGEIPGEWGLLLELMEFDHNFLNGSIPDLSPLVELRILRLNNNRLSGPIPEFLATLPSLQELSLDYNDFTEIPQSLLNKKGLNLTYSNNPNLRTKTFDSNHKWRLRVVVGSVAGGLVGIFIIGASLVSYILKRRPSSDLGVSLEDMPKSVQAFSLREVKAITDNYKKTIGKGGFGPVYYGKLPGGDEVAVKVRAADSKQGRQEFLNEIRLLSRLHHRNLVPLVGYCLDGQQQILIYIFMSQGTLHDHLYSRDSKVKGFPKLKKTLDWKTRLDIALNAARGLEYLHKDCNPPVIHRDVKSSNILLTDKLKAKVADLGISKLALEDEKSGISTAIKGTIGYLDPDYYVRQKLTTKSDVYSFGVVLLEIITGRRPRDFDLLGSTQSSLADWVRDTLETESLMAMVDPTLEEDYREESLSMIANLAMSCLSAKGTDRPEMGNVVHKLVEALRVEAESHIKTFLDCSLEDDPKIPFPRKAVVHSPHHILRFNSLPAKISNASTSRTSSASFSGSVTWSSLGEAR